VSLSACALKTPEGGPASTWHGRRRLAESIASLASLPHACYLHSMGVRIRLARFGRRNLPFYRIFVADSRCPRDGRHLEVVGHYDPLPGAWRAARSTQLPLGVSRAAGCVCVAGD